MPTDTRAITPLAALLIVLAACGGGSSGSDPTSPTDGDRRWAHADALVLPDGARLCPWTMALSADGSTLAVADTIVDPDDADVSSTANVYVFTRDGDAWSGPAVIAVGSFLRALALDARGTTLAVALSGDVRLFQRGNDGWAQLVALRSTSTELASSYDLGRAVALSGDGTTLAVGDPAMTEDEPDRVHVFERANAAWSLKQSLPGPERAASFGESLAMSRDGRTLAMGDLLRRDVLAYVYTRGPTGYGEERTLSAPSSTRSTFVESLTLSGDGRTLAAWTYAGKALVLASDGSQEYDFPVATEVPCLAGPAVALDRDGAALAVSTCDDDRHGAVDVYSAGAGRWSPPVHLAGPADAQFGSALAFSDDGALLAVLAPSAGGVGAVYLYR